MSDEDVSLSARLDQARLFIRKTYSKIDPELPALLEVLEDVGAAECWHKHSTFFDHLHNVYRTLKLWNCPDSIARCGLFHSSYSNSYVNLAIFEPNVDRQKVRDLIGNDAEELVHWFCIVPRQELIFDMLVSKYSDQVAGWGRKQSETLGKAAIDKRTILVPPEGLVVKHIRTGEDLLVPRRLIVIFLILTIADFSDQWYGWQDTLFGNADGKMEFSRNDGSPLWPGEGKPGSWMPAISRLGLILSHILRDEEEYEAAEKEQGRGLSSRPFSQIDIRAPPILKHCTEMVSPLDQVESLNLYWEAVCRKEDHGPGNESAKSSLTKAMQHNPYLAEPHILLAQLLLAEGEWKDAQKEASQGLKLLLEWGTQWDKRMTWEGWISWARVLKTSGEEKTWPKSGWGLINLGLVK